MPEKLLEKRPGGELPLGSDQVFLLLRTLRQHRQLLEAAHQDAKRLLAAETPPCYVVDYEELHRYMYDAEARPETLVQLEYLFSHEDITFIIGYGTALEVLHRIRLISGFDASTMPGRQLRLDDLMRELSPLDKLRFDPDLSLRRIIERTPHHVVAISRLYDLLSQENFVDVSEIEKRLGGDIIDMEAFETMLAALQIARPHLTYPNIADAWNFGTVVGLRRFSGKDGFDFFPYLLTDTRPLLDERNWANDPSAEAWGFDGRVSRRPLSGAYSHVVSTLEPDPSTACDHTARLICQIGAAELDLRLSRGYQLPVPQWEEFELEDLESLSQAGSELQSRLQASAEFASDSVVSEAQRILDNTRQAIANWRTLQGDVRRIESPRKLFDIIVGVSRALTTPLSHPQTLQTLWDTAINRTSAEGISFLAKRYADVAEPSYPYIEIEKHEEGYFVFRWPTNLAIEQLLDAFVWAFSRHAAETVELHVGTGERIHTFDATFPLSFSDIRKELGSPPRWIRMDGRDFDLYADILTDPGVTPEVGVLVSNPNRTHLAELYSATCARFLFRSLLLKVFEDAGLP
jgi:hypothetical protein